VPGCEALGENFSESLNNFIASIIEPCVTTKSCIEESSHTLYIVEKEIIFSLTALDYQEEYPYF